jgi:putative tricarboxylic transport membrane protein
MKTRTYFCAAIVLAVALALIPMLAPAQDKYPSRNIDYIIGWGAGGGSDYFGRVINMPMRKLLNVNVNVVNMPGAAESIATEHVQRQPADGYTIFGATSELSTGQLLGRTKFNYKDFTPIIRAHVDVGGFQAAPNKNFKDWNEFLNYAKSSNRKMRIGGTGAASFDMLVAQIIIDSAGITDKCNYIPFDSAGEMHAALLGGHIDAMYEEPGVTVDMISAGKMVLLLVFSEKRLAKFPNVPSAGELKYEIPPMLWRGILVKKGTPQEIVDLLEKNYTQSMKDPMYVAFEKDRLLDLFPGYLNSKDWEADLVREYAAYEKVISKLGLKKQ